MQALAVEPQLYRRMEDVAQVHRASVEKILDEAIRRYLWDVERQQIAEESKIYRARYADLRTKYLGQYIAMRDGQVADHDVDFQTLRLRVRQRFGHASVMITRVEEVAEPTLVRRGFRLGTVNL